MDIYENKSATKFITDEASTEWVVDRFEVGNGINVYIQGAEFPYKGMATPEAISSANIVKRMLLDGIKAINPFLLLFNDYRVKLISIFSRIGGMAMKSYFLKSEFQTAFTQELQGVTRTLLTEMGIKENAKLTSKLISHIFEYDSAYRFRVQDILSETTPERLYNAPRREINRLLNISYSRDYEEVRAKFRLIGKLLTFALLIPKIRKAFKKAIKESDFKKLQLDESDRYWTAQRVDYKFWGKTNEERKEWLKEMNYKVPTYQQVKR